MPQCRTKMWMSAQGQHKDTHVKGVAFKKNRKGKERKQKKKRSHRAFPRGPPPQYYPGSNLLNLAARMGSGEPG